MSTVAKIKIGNTNNQAVRSKASLISKPLKQAPWLFVLLWKHYAAQY